MVAAAALIFSLRLLDVSAATLRILMVMRGRRLLAWVLGFFQALVFVVAIREVLSNVDNLLNFGAYAAGFATGTVIGMWLEEWLAVGYGHMRVISSRHGAAITAALRANGYAVTEIAGRGRDGTVDVLAVSVPRREVATVQRLVEREDAEAFVTVEDVRPLWRGYWRRKPSNR